MLTFKQFSGINNVQPPERLSPSALTVASNVDIGLTGELSRRAGYTRASTDAHTNLFDSGTLRLATAGLNGDLINLDTGVVLYPSLGHDRVWYAELPDHRVAFSNGLITRVTDGVKTTQWGVNPPAGVGAGANALGDLFEGEYRYALTHVREVDGLESAPVFSEPLQITSGGVFISGIPVRTGCTTNIYLTSHNDGQFYLAGSTTASAYGFTGTNDDLVQPCRTEFTTPPPAGRCLTAWRNRVLVAVDNVLYATEPTSFERVNVRRDFKQFIDPITSVTPVDDGIYVGTTRELVFLAGDKFDSLMYRKVADKGVVLGSSVSVRGELVRQGEGAGLGSAMICICDGHILAGFNGGGIVRLTDGVYRTQAAEVFATFRQINGVPQYMAIPR